MEALRKKLCYTQKWKKYLKNKCQTVFHKYEKQLTMHNIFKHTHISQLQNSKKNILLHNVENIIEVEILCYSYIMTYHKEQ